MHRTVLLLTGLIIGGCITPREKRDLQNDLFNVQTRLLTLERSLSDTSKDARHTGESASRRLASTQSEMERIGHEMQQIRGDIDALKVGVTTGQMPGRENQQNSVSSQLGRLSDRLDDIEQNQEELLDALKKAGLSKSSKKTASKKTGTIEELQNFFDGKKYKQVIEDAPRLTSTGSAADKEKARFLLAEAYFKLGKMREAALKYSEFIESHPSPKLIPSVKLRLGDCFRHLGDKATAQIYYEELMKEFPDSDEATKAKERLGQEEQKSQSEDS